MFCHMQIQFHSSNSTYCHGAVITYIHFWKRQKWSCCCEYFDLLTDSYSYLFPSVSGRSLIPTGANRAKRRCGWEVRQMSVMFHTSWVSSVHYFHTFFTDFAPERNTWAHGFLIRWLSCKIDFLLKLLDLRKNTFKDMTMPLKVIRYVLIIREIMYINQTPFGGTRLCGSADPSYPGHWCWKQGILDLCTVVSINQ